MTNLTVLNKSIQSTLEWVNDIEAMLGWDSNDKTKALAILRATLHEVRDNLPINDLAHLSAQLPIVIRGLLFESWRPAITPLKERKKEQFIESIASKLADVHKDVDVEQAIHAVFQTMANRIDPLEIDKLTKILPKGARECLIESVG